MKATAVIRRRPHMLVFWRAPASGLRVQDVRQEGHKAKLLGGGPLPLTPCTLFLPHIRPCKLPDLRRRRQARPPAHFAKCAQVRGGRVLGRDLVRCQVPVHACVCVFVCAYLFKFVCACACVFVRVFERVRACLHTFVRALCTPPRLLRCDNTIFWAMCDGSY